MEVVAQLVRASDCGSEGRGFETPHPPYKVQIVVNQLFALSFCDTDYAERADIHGLDSE